MSDVKITIRGIQELQDINAHMIAALKPSNDLGRAIQFATTEAHHYLISIVHVASGAYRAAQRMAIEQGGSRGVVFTDPGAVNPFGQRPAVYGPIEEGRGGSHAAYARTVGERGEQIAMRALKYLDEALVA